MAKNRKFTSRDYVMRCLESVNESLLYVHLINMAKKRVYRLSEITTNEEAEIVQNLTDKEIEAAQAIIESVGNQVGQWVRESPCGGDSYLGPNDLAQIWLKFADEVQRLFKTEKK